jgi:hypothetical protein
MKLIPDLPCVTSENPIIIYDDATPKLYACLGCGPSYKTKCYSFNPTAAAAANAWAPLGTSNYVHSLGVFVDGKIYLTPGSSGSRWDIFDPEKNTFSKWSSRSTNPFIPHRPGVNFINILLAAFLFESVLPNFFLYYC